LAWFDGKDDTLTVASFDFTTGQTINLWVNPANLESYRSLFGLNTVENYMRYKAGSETEMFQFEPDNNTAYDIDCGAAGVIQKDKWTMYTFIWNTDRTMDAYFNGILVGSSSATEDSTDGKTMKITKFGHGYDAFPFNGAMTEISHYSDILTQAEVNDLFNDGKAKSALEADGSAGLVGYWRNNGLSTWTDLTGDGNDGTVTCDETILIPAGVDATRDNQGFIMNRQRDTSSLNQTSESDNTYGVDLGSTSTFAAGEAFSMTFWAKPRDITANRVMGFDGNDYLQFKDTNEFRIKANNVIDDLAINDPSSWTADEWVHISIVRNPGDLVTLYVNGTAQTDPETADEAFDYRYIGGLASNKYRGQLDNFLIYDDELSAAEVLRNYNAGKGSHRN
jgi:hypothetical protein